MTLLATRRMILFGFVASVVPAGLAAQQTIDLPREDRVITATPTQVFGVGREEGEAWEVFSNVAGVAFDRAGNLYVLDRDNARVVVFGRDGRHLRDVGRKGEGPGEFVLPMSMTVLPTDQLAVFDFGNRAISLFDANGAYQKLVRSAPEFGMPRSDLSTGAGGLLMTGSALTGGFGDRGGGLPEVGDSLPILRISPTDGSTTVLTRAPTAQPTVQASGGRNDRQVRVTQPPTFSPAVNWSPVSDGGIAISAGASWEVSIIDASGRTMRVLKRAIPVRRVTELDKDLARQQRREQLESGAGMIRVTFENGRRSVGTGGSMPAQQIEQNLAQMTFAETVPVVRDLRGDRDGRIWVRREAGPGSTAELIDIVSTSGNYFGTVRGLALPAAFGPDGRFALIQTDDLGVQRVIVYQIPRTMFSGR